MLTEGTVAADNPFRHSDAATVSVQLLAPAVMDVIHHMCRAEFFVEPVSDAPRVDLCHSGQP